MCFILVLIDLSAGALHLQLHAVLAEVFFMLLLLLAASRHSLPALLQCHINP